RGWPPRGGGGSRACRPGGDRVGRGPHAPAAAPTKEPPAGGAPDGACWAPGISGGPPGCHQLHQSRRPPQRERVMRANGLVRDALSMLEQRGFVPVVGSKGKHFK